MRKKVSQNILTSSKKTQVLHAFFLIQQIHLGTSHSKPRLIFKKKNKIKKTLFFFVFWIVLKLNELEEKYFFL